MTSDHLSLLFDSAHLYSWSNELNLHVIRIEQGKATPGDPGRIFSWLETEGIIQSTSRDTIIEILEWCRILSHFAGGVDSEGDILWVPGSQFGLQQHWQYGGFQPVERTIRGTRRGRESDIHHWTAGCQGTTGFLRCTLRTVNIPVIRADGCGHAIPHFVADGIFISHADDPYNQVMKNFTPSISMSEILILDRALDRYFDNCDYVGRGVLWAVLQLMPDQLVEMHCRDIHAGLEPRDSEVYNFLRRKMTFEEMERRRLWERLNDEVESRGGCEEMI